MKSNVGGIDRILRIVLGLVLIGLTLTGTIGAWGWLVNIGALTYGIGAIVNMAWPRTPDAAWYINYAMVLSTAIVIGLGLLYMWIAKPYDHGTAPAGDAWKVGR